MAPRPNKLSQFWQEILDRRVIRTITVYVAVSFGLMELIDIIEGPLNLPAWVLSVSIVISAIGFIFIIPLSWIFNFGPDGIKRNKNRHFKLLPETNEDIEGMSLFEEDLKYEEETTKADKNSGRILGISSFTIIGLAAVLFLFYGGKSVAFNEKDLVVVADFVNHTEELIFDHSLNTALEISIDQSRHINVVPYKRMQEVLKRIGKESGTVIDEALCREIAIREGAKAYITPEISRVGKQYILSGKLQETENGELVNSMIYYCESQDEIIGALDRMSKKMRRHLGESRYKISGQSKPLEMVTTSSLEALKQFSLGHEYLINVDFENAVVHYRMAIGLDSSFTAAKASLGNLLYERFDPVEGKRWLDEAILSIDNLTDREKYSILSFYAFNVDRDLDKSLEYTRTLIELYPDRAAARNNLAWYLFYQGRYEESVVEYKKAIALDPYFILSYRGLIYIYNSYLGQSDSSIHWAKKMISYNPENPWGCFYLGVGYFIQDNLAEAMEAFEKGREFNPELLINQYNLAHTYRALEKYEQAVVVLKKIIESRSEESDAHYYLGICYELMGADELAISHYEKVLSMVEDMESENPHNPVTLITKGTVLSRLGMKEEGMEAGRRGFELDSSNHYSFVKLLAVQQYPEQALHHLEIALEDGFWDICWIKMDPDLSSLKNDERFLRLLDRYFN